MPNPQLLERIMQVVQHDAPQATRNCQITPVSGGDINTSFLLTDGNNHYFVKSLANEDAEAMHTAEAKGLQALAQASALAVPAVIGQGRFESTSFLVLQALNLDGPRDWQALGHALAQVHRVGGEYFGWPADNFIGTTLQRNKQHDHWGEFWWQERLLPQLELAYNNGHGTKLQPMARAVQDVCRRLLDDHRPSASLVHGDLWGGNVGFLETGKPAVFDPACYYGDREVDLAMTQLFGGFSDDFYSAYTAAWPLTDGHQQRATLYNLYHLLNHLNLFGSGYLSQCLSSIKQLTREL